MEFSDPFIHSQTQKTIFLSSILYHFLICQFAFKSQHTALAYILHNLNLNYSFVIEGVQRWLTSPINLQYKIHSPMSLLIRLAAFLYTSISIFISTANQLSFISCILTTSLITYIIYSILSSVRPVILQGKTISTILLLLIAFKL